MAGVIQRARDEGVRQGRVEGVRQGRVEGVRQGRVEGVRQGLVQGLERLLQRRFGILPTQVAERLRHASTTELETWAENVLDAETLDQVFEPRV